MEKIRVERFAARRRRRRPVRALLAILLVLAAVSFASVQLRTRPADGQASDLQAAIKELLAESRNSTYVRVDGKGVVASGAARITEDTAQGRLLARRGALADARRNLLLLRQELLERPELKAGLRRISGHVGRHVVRSERVDGGLYRVEIEISVEEWLSSDFDGLFFSSGSPDERGRRIMKGVYS
jgi:hypothetical protein